MYKLLTNEVNAAIRACFDAGADEVLVNDSHGSGYNILFEELDLRCRIIHGKNCSGPHWLPLLDRSVDAMVMIGMHAMGGTPVSITPHSLWKVNGGKIFMSECSMAAAIAGDLDIPAVMLSGDDKITAELSEKIPGIVTAEVKKALSPYQACSMIPQAACDLIYNQVKVALAKRDTIAPYKVKGPVSLTLLDSSDHCPPLKEVGQEVTADTITEAFLAFERAMPWCTFDTQQPDGFSFPL